MEWPELNGLAFVDILDEPVLLESRVEAVDGTALTLAAPTGAYGMPVLPAPGETVLVAWNTLRGYFERKGVVESSLRMPQPRMTVRPLGEVRRLQRRAHVRVPQLTPVDLIVSGGRLRASLLDVSESSLRCVVDRPCPLSMDALVSVTLELSGGEQVEVLCTPARMYALDDHHLEVGLTFLDVVERLGNRIRKHVFAQQVRDRAMGLLASALRLAASLVVSLLMWLPTVPGALEASEDPARLAGRYLLALLIARIGVGVVFRVIGAYAKPEVAEEEPEPPPAPAPAEDEQSPFGRRREDVVAALANDDQDLLDEALDEVEDTAALVP